MSSAVFLYVSLCFYVAYVIVAVSWVGMHEEAHVSVNDYFGVNSAVTYSWGTPALPLYGLTTNVTLANLSKEQAVAARDLHAMNEIVSYNVLSIIQAIFLGLYLTTIALLMFGKKKEETK